MPDLNDMYMAGDIPDYSNAPEMELTANVGDDVKAPNKESPDDNLDSLEPLASVKRTADAEKNALHLKRFAERCYQRDAVERAFLREQAIERLKNEGFRSPARMVDDALSQTRPRILRHEEGVFLVEDDPWPDPVDSGELLDELVDLFRRFVHLPDDAYIPLSLWAVHCHAHDSFDVSPILAITSPVMRCGKTTLLLVLSAIVPKALHVANLTEATLFRVIEAYKPTLLVDEADTFVHDRSELIGILNAGHLRHSAYVLRCVGDNLEPKQFNVWAPKAIAAIGKLPGTIVDRSIPISLQRKPRGAKCERLRLASINAQCCDIRRRCARWAIDHAQALQKSRPALPETLNDRAADNWEPLLAIADEVNTACGRRTREVAGEAREVEQSNREKLLVDLRELFKSMAAEIEFDEGSAELFEPQETDTGLFSADICEALAKLEHRPWAEYGRARKPITPVGLARLLSGFDVRPKSFRSKDKNCRGYRLSELKPVFERYLPGDPLSRSATPQQPSPHAADDVF